MSQDSYSFRFSPDFMEFRFDSIGPNGIVEKVVKFEELEWENWFNLGFGDYSSEKNEIDDIAVTNNLDTEKVLISVGKAVELFLENNPLATIVFTGSTKARSMLYQRKLLRYLTQLSDKYVINGLLNGRWTAINAREQFDAFSVYLNNNLRNKDNEG